MKYLEQCLILLSACLVYVVDVEDEVIIRSAYLIIRRSL